MVGIISYGYRIHLHRLEGLEVFVPRGLLIIVSFSSASASDILNQQSN
jgi:hypothetical protein